MMAEQSLPLRVWGVALYLVNWTTDTWVNIVVHGGISDLNYFTFCIA